MSTVRFRGSSTILARAIDGAEGSAIGIRVRLVAGSGISRRECNDEMQMNLMPLLHMPQVGCSLLGLREWPRRSEDSASQGGRRLPPGASPRRELERRGS